MQCGPHLAWGSGQASGLPGPDSGRRSCIHAVKNLDPRSPPPALCAPGSRGQKRDPPEAEEFTQAECAACSVHAARPGWGTGTASGVGRARWPSSPGTRLVSHTAQILTGTISFYFTCKNKGFNPMKDIHGKPTADILLIGERLDTFPRINL